MKKVIVNLFLLFSCFGCVYDTKDPKTSMDDSLINTDTTKVPKTFSDKALLVDSLSIVSQNVAYGNVHFGVTHKEFKKIKPIPPAGFETVGNSKYNFEWFFDKDDELYFLQLTSSSEDASYLDNDLKGQAENLVDVITKKYGAPTTDDIYPSILHLEKGRINFYKEWFIGNKTIRIGIGESDYSDTFFAVCWIFDKKRYDAYEKSRDTLEDKKKDTDANKF